MINNNHLLSNQYKTIMGFLLTILSKKLIDKISDLGIQIADFSMLLELAFEKCFQKNNDNNYDSLLQIVHEGSFFRINKKNFNNMLLLPSHIFDALCFKLDNLIDFISFVSCMNINTIIDINVNPKNIINSLKLDVQSIETEIFLDNLSLINKSFIKYLVTDKTSMGYDAGGLTKDFYSLISEEILKLCIDVDGFMYPKNNSDIPSNVWKFYGIMLCRSIFLEKMSIGINFHPILCYFFLNGIKNISIKHFFDQLTLFNVDYIANIKKVIDMDQTLYNQFMILQCEDLVSKSLYVGNKIYEKYIYPEVIHIVDGFKIALSRYSYTSYLSLVTLYRYINANWKYDIFGNSSHSLKQNLNIDITEINLQSSKNKTEYNKIEYFKNTFLTVLDQYNQFDTPTLKKFIKFWLGTSSISTFDGLNCTIKIIKLDTYNCFESHTCFNQLDIGYKYVTSSLQLDESIKQMINNTLTNQELCENVGYRMQFM